MRKKRESKSSGSFAVKSGSVEVPVYFRSRVVAGRAYDEFRVCFYGADGQRVQRRFSNEADARAEANRVATRLARSEAAQAAVAPRDHHDFAAAVALVTPLGVSVLGALTEYVSARAQLPVGTTLADAVRSFGRQSRADDPRPVAELVAEIVAGRKADGVSDVYLRDLKGRLGKFGEVFRCPLGSVSAALVRDFLGRLKTDTGEEASARTRKNYLRLISALYAFAGERRYIAAELAADIRAIKPPKSAAADAAIFSPAEMQAILHAARPDLVPALAIGGFAGLRTAEIARLDWADVRLVEQVIVLNASKAKTAARRVVPIVPNLAAWLAPFANATGKLSPATTDRTLSTQFSRAGIRAGVQWIPNGLRHSFCSYRLAVTHDPARVATEAGNSAQMVHQHYKALVTEADGKAWFKIAPRQAESGGVLIPFKSAQSA